MKQATQSGWLVCNEGTFVTLYDANGNYIEVAFNNEGNLYSYSPDGYDWNDLPQSVINLVNLWMTTK